MPLKVSLKCLWACLENISQKGNTYKLFKNIAQRKEMRILIADH